MNDKKLGLEAAFTSSHDEHTGFDSFGNKEFTRVDEIGISKRLYIATAAMQGMLSNSNENLVYTNTALLVKEAYNVADEMLRQELEEIDD